MGTSHEEIYEVVRRIPRGKVATYGTVARLVGPPCGARQVGWALGALRDERVQPPVPWQRVVNARGMSSLGGEQLRLLREEGVETTGLGGIDLSEYGWDGTDREEGGRLDRLSLFS